MTDVATAAPMLGIVSVGDTSRTIAPVPVTVLPSIVVFASYACTVDQITSHSKTPTAAEFAAATSERPKDVKSASAAVPAPVKYATLSASEVNHAIADKFAFCACTSVPITNQRFDLAVATLVKSLRLFALSSNVAASILFCTSTRLAQTAACVPATLQSVIQYIVSPTSTVVQEAPPILPATLILYVCPASAAG